MLVEPEVQSLEQDLNIESWAPNMFENEQRLASLPHGRGIQLGHAFTTQPTGKR